MKEAYQLPATGFVRVADIIKVIPVGKSTWWAGVKEGRFPQPVKLSTRTTAWRVEDIRAWMEEKANKSLGENSRAK